MKLRIRHTKLGKIRFTSHRDTARHWERAVRKADLALGGLRMAFSAGFTPRPRMAFGLALPTGAESLAELLDVDLVDTADAPSLGEMAGAFETALPDGYQVTAVVARADGGPSLQEDVVAASWAIAIDGVAREELERAVAGALAAPSLRVERERKGQRSTDEVRWAIESLAVADGCDLLGAIADGDDRPHLHAVLATTARGLRPVELVTAVLAGHDPIDATGRVVRMEQWIERDGARREIVPVSPRAAGVVATPA